MAESPELVLGPLLRFADHHQATVWVETDRPCTVRVLGHTASTWTVHGHHYALLVVDGLEPGTTTPYQVHLDDAQVWPPQDSPFPASAIRTLHHDDNVRLAFGSCRKDAPHDAHGLATVGADALVALARRMSAEDPDRWPSTLLMAGDQVYADEPSPQMRSRLSQAHADGSELQHEVRDFEEYTWLYHSTWSHPAVRWLMSTVPTCMLLDDHDLRDDWNTSASWRRDMAGKAWWRDRVVGAFASYWVYQHLGNLSPAELAQDSVYSALLTAPDDAARTTALEDFAWRSDQHPESARWSFYRDLSSGDGCRVRLVAMDSRCSRRLDDDDRAMLDDEEWAWVRDHSVTDVDHLLLVTTLPIFMLHVLHDIEQWSEQMTAPRHHPRQRVVMEKLRRAVDLEHWPAFGESFTAVVQLLRDVATAPGGPATVLVLSGDVHCSYTATVDVDAGNDSQNSAAVHQLVMSPFRNPLHRPIRLVNRVAEHAWLRGITSTLARWAGAPTPAADWSVQHGPWFDNGVMSIELEGRQARVHIDHAGVDDGEQVLRRTRTIDLTTTLT